LNIYILSFCNFILFVLYSYYIIPILVQVSFIHRYFASENVWAQCDNIIGHQSYHWRCSNCVKCAQKKRKRIS